MYKKETRTKNLTLRDIHVGDWVQVWSPTVERYSPPMKIISIIVDGTIYLSLGEGCECDPWEENIENVDALPITEEVLTGFGFFVDTNQKDIGHFAPDVYYNKEYIGYLSSYPKKSLNIDKQSFKYIHTYQSYLYKRKSGICLEWKGVNKQQESHEME